jgi:hypothetical protein
VFPDRPTNHAAATAFVGTPFRYEIVGLAPSLLNRTRTHCSLNRPFIGLRRPISLMIVSGPFGSGKGFNGATDTWFLLRSVFDEDFHRAKIFRSMSFVRD